MDKRPDVAVVIVTYNSANRIRACLDSLASQGEELSIEVIVIDNGSVDETVSLIRSRYPWVQLVVDLNNRGFAWASNRGIERSNSDVLLLLNPDTCLPLAGLRAAVGRLISDPQVAILGCKLLRPDGTFDHAAKRGFPTPLSSLGYFTHIHKFAPKGSVFTGYLAPHLNDDEEGFVDAVNGAFMLVRKEAIDEVGLLDEEYWMYGEDLDWCWRFREAGWRVLYWPSMTVTHIKGGSTDGARGLRLNLSFFRAMWRFYSQHPGQNDPFALRVLVAAGICLLFIISAGTSSISRRARDFRLLLGLTRSRPEALHIE